MENFQDDHGAVHHLAADFLFQVAGLRRRNLVVDQDGFDLVADVVGDEVVDFLALADAEITGGIETGAFLDEGLDDLEAQRLAAEAA